MGQLLV